MIELTVLIAVVWFVLAHTSQPKPVRVRRGRHAA